MPDMRRLLIAVAAMTCCLAAAGGASAQCMLVNPSFDMLGSPGTVFAGWSQFGPVALSTSTVHGNYAARVTGPNTGKFDVSGVWQPLPCTPGQRWTASVCVSHSSAKPLSGQSSAILNVEWRDAGGNLISYESHTAADASTPVDVWRIYSVQSQPAPAGTASIHFLLGVLQGPSDPTPQVTFDAATCVGVSPAALDNLQWSDFPSGRAVAFSGRTWRVKGPGYYGPGPNLFDNSSDAVWVDANGRLHLAIHKIGGSWYSSEVALTDSLGYGDYLFTTRGRLDQLDPNVVLGMFLWQYGPCYDPGYLWWNPYNEIDVEFSRWGSAGSADAQFVAQPATNGGNLFRFNATFGDTEVTTHAMRWLPQRVEFRSWRGGPDAESPASQIASWTYTGANLPRPDMPRVHLNLWQLNAPAAAQEAVFDAFAFRPACPSGFCGIVGVLPAPSPSAASVKLAAAAPNPSASGTTLRYTLATSAEADLSIFDISGRRIRRLASGIVGPGEHAVVWNARNDTGQRVPPGVYLVRLRTPDTAETRRVIILE